MDRIADSFRQGGTVSVERCRALVGKEEVGRWVFLAIHYNVGRGVLMFTDKPDQPQDNQGGAANANIQQVSVSGHNATSGE